MKFICDDGNAPIEIEADSHREAAEEYVEGGDWGDRSETTWVQVGVTPVDDPDDFRSITVTLEAEEPDCVDDQEHDWRSPYSVLGGLKENPGVQGHGGGVIIKEVCAHCGHYKITDTWAQNPCNGEQGLTSVEYQDADEETKEWLKEYNEEDGWLPQWLADYLDCLPTVKMTEDEAREYVADHTDEDDLDDDDLEHAFAALFGRRADNQDRIEGLWSHLCAAV